MTAGGAAAWGGVGGLGRGGGLSRTMSNHSALRGIYHPASSAPKVSSGLWRSGSGSGMAMGMISGGNNSRDEASGASESGGESDTLPNFGGGSTAKKMGGTTLTVVGVVDGVDEAAIENDLSSGVALDLGTVDTDPAPHVKSEQQSQQQQQQQVDGRGNERGNMHSTSSGTVTPNDLMMTLSPAQPHPHTPTRTVSQKGLWGGGGGGGIGFVKERNREAAPKRRWTVAENTVG